MEDFPFGPGPSVFKVGGKMFAISALDRTPLEVSVKSEPELALQLRLTHAAVRPGCHLNKRHRNTVTLDGSLPDKLIRDLVEDSYDLVVSALPRARVGSSDGRPRPARARAERIGPAARPRLADECARLPTLGSIRRDSTLCA